MVIAYFDFSSTRKPPGFMRYHQIALEDLESGKCRVQYCNFRMLSCQYHMHIHQIKCIKYQFFEGFIFCGRQI